MKLGRLMLLFGALLTLMPRASAQQGAPGGAKPSGIGIAIGGISGISGYHRLDPLHFMQGTLALSNYGNAFAIAADYGIYAPKLFEYSKHVVAYYGLGGMLVKLPRLVFFGNDVTRDRVYVGARIPLGVQFFIPDAPLQLGLEMTPGMFIVPATYVSLDATFLVRFLF